MSANEPKLIKEYREITEELKSLEEILDRNIELSGRLTEKLNPILGKLIKHNKTKDENEPQCSLAQKLRELSHKATHVEMEFEFLLDAQQL